MKLGITVVKNNPTTKTNLINIFIQKNKLPSDLYSKAWIKNYFRRIILLFPKNYIQIHSKLKKSILIQVNTLKIKS